ncbi:hypothetical protein [Streptomyces olivaceoviridis]|uniref:hypothetical protein n=1 Tax=Streptomyces olivaceoviridis TaxID=1921 RepID=UPI00378AC968
MLDRRFGDAALTERGLDEVRDVLVATGARATVEAKLDRLAAQGLRHFDGALLDPEGAGPLRALLLATAGARPGGEAAVRPRPAQGPYAPQPRGGAGSGR